MTASVRTLSRGLLVLASGILLALRFGFNYGIGNHNSYLLRALQKANPGLWAHDWLASTQDYHPVFTECAAFIMRCNSSGWPFAMANVLFILLGTIAVYLIVREVAGDSFPVAPFLIVVAFMGASSTYSVSGSYLYSATFQPSTVAAVAFLFATLYFVRQRYWISGCFVALGGAFHLNFAILAFPLFGLAHVCAGGRPPMRRLVLQLGPVLVPLAWLSPLWLGQAQSAQADEARYIFQHVLSPQHYLPSHFLTEFAVYYAWAGLGIVSGLLIVPESSGSKQLRVLWLSSLILVTAATLLTSLTFVPAVSQLYFWRLAPFTVLFSQVFAAAGWARFMSTPMARTGLRAALMCLLVAALVWFTFRYHYGEFRFLHYTLLIVLAVSCFVRWVWGLVRGKWPNTITMGMVVAVWLAAALVPAMQMGTRSTLLTGLPKAEEELYHWAESTDKATVFLIPPDLENFRLWSKRAVIVDVKSAPVAPDALLEWYRRACTVSGLSQAASRREIVDGYGRLDSARVAQIYQTYVFDYFVVRQSQSFTGMKGADLVFQNDAFRAYRYAIRPAESVS